MENEIRVFGLVPDQVVGVVCAVYEARSGVLAAYCCSFLLVADYACDGPVWVGFGEDVEEVSAYVACCARSDRIKMLSPGSFLLCEFDCKRQAYMKTFGGVLVLMMNSGFRARSSGESEEHNARRR